MTSLVISPIPTYQGSWATSRCGRTKPWFRRTRHSWPEWCSSLTWTPHSPLGPGRSMASAGSSRTSVAPLPVEEGLRGLVEAEPVDSPVVLLASALCGLLEGSIPPEGAVEEGLCRSPCSVNIAVCMSSDGCRRRTRRRSLRTADSSIQGPRMVEHSSVISPFCGLSLPTIPYPAESSGFGRAFSWHTPPSPRRMGVSFPLRRGPR